MTVSSVRVTNTLDNLKKKNTVYSHSLLYYGFYYFCSSKGKYYPPP